MHPLSSVPAPFKSSLKQAQKPGYQYPKTNKTRNGTVKKFSVVIA